MFRRTFALAGVLLLAFAPGVASAQTYGGATVAVSDSTVVPGQSVTVTACCFSGTVEFTLAGRVVGTGFAGPDGNVSLTFNVPTDLAPGTYAVTASGQALDGSGPLTATTNITVVGSAVVPAPTPLRVGVGTGTLPRTGAESTFPLLQAGTVLVLVGAGVLFSIRNRRRGATVTDQS